MSSCNKELGSDDHLDGSFTRFGKRSVRAFVLVTSIVFLIALKKKYLVKEASLFYVTLFIILATIVLGILGLTDSYVFDQVSLGMGIAIGMHIMDF